MNDEAGTANAAAPAAPPENPQEHALPGTADRGWQRSPERYGRRARHGSRRWDSRATVALGVAGGLAVAAVAYANLRGPGITANVTAFDPADNHVTIHFVVVRDQPDNPGTCYLRARSVSGAEVGSAEVHVAAGSKRVTLTYRLTTSDTPVTGEVQRCRYDT